MQDIQVVVPLSIFADADGNISFEHVQQAKDMAERTTVLQNGINAMAAEMRDVGKQLHAIMTELDGMDQAKAFRNAVDVLTNYRSPLEAN